MRLFHTGDLHIGKRLFEYALLEDQAAALDQMVQLTQDYRPDAFLLAGDVYDKSIPSAEAVTLLDDFLTRLSETGTRIFMVSGNHDSPERLAFGSRLMAQTGVHVAGSYQGTVSQVTLHDHLGPVHIHLLPFLKPSNAMPWFSEQAIETTEDAVRAALGAAPLDLSARNVLVAHQFVINGLQQPERSDSETVFVGGLDQVDASVFDGYDYVALGHLHGPQPIGRETVRYAGSPLKYSFSEVRHRKSLTMIDLLEKDDVRLTMLPVEPIRDLREIRGPLEELVKAGQEALDADRSSAADYIRAVLTNEEPVFDALGQLRRVYPNLMHIEFENSRTSRDSSSKTAASGDVAQKSPLQLFSEFYESQTGATLSGEQQSILVRVFDHAGGAD